jgi:hypothetical protein
MHGYFINSKLYRKLTELIDPMIYENARKEKINKKIENERKERIIIKD